MKLGDTGEIRLNGEKPYQSGTPAKVVAFGLNRHSEIVFTLQLETGVEIVLPFEKMQTDWDFWTERRGAPNADPRFTPD